MTLPQIDHEARKKGIGGSDAAAIIGKSPYATALDIYREKVGEAAPKETTPQMLRGKYLEETAVAIYCDLTGRRVRRQPQKVHKDFPFILGNIDRQVLAELGTDTGVTKGTGLVEVKCPGMRTFLRYDREGLPAHIIIQGQHYLGVTGYAWMDFIIFNADLWKLRHFTVERDDAFIEGLFEAERRFWTEHVEKRVPPPALGMLHQALPEIELPEVDGEIVTREDPEFAAAAEMLQQAQRLVDDADLVKEQAIQRLKELVGGYGVFEGAGLRAYWKPQAGRKTFDRKALEGTRPLDRMKVLNALADYQDSVDADFLKSLSDALGACDVDFAAFDKVGKSFDTFRPYFLKPVPEDEE